MCVCARVCSLLSRVFVSDSLGPHGLQPARVLGPWNSPGKDTEWVAIPSPGDFPNPGIQPRSLALKADSLPYDHQGSLLDRLKYGPVKTVCEIKRLCT